MTTKALEKVPNYLVQEDNDLGVDSIGPEDIQIPRLKIVQGPSQIKQDFPKKFRDGDIYNSLTKMNLGDEVEFFVLNHWKSNVWFSEDFKMIGTTYFDKATKQEIFVGQDEEYCRSHKDEAINSHNYMIVMADELEEGKPVPFPIIFSCASAAVKSARQLNGRILENANKKLPIWSQLVSMTTILQKFTKGSAYLPDFSYPRYATKGEAAKLQQLFKASKSLLNKQEVHIDTEPEAEAEPATAPVKKTAPRKRKKESVRKQEEPQEDIPEGEDDLW